VSVRQYDEGHGERHYGHCIVAGIDQYPLKISKSMEKKKIDKRSKLKPFLKVVNYNHVMPTRSVSPPPLSLLSKPAGSARVRDESRRALRSAD
jgi:large subunit ribosomal protein L27e